MFMYNLCPALIAYRTRDRMGEGRGGEGRRGREADRALYNRMDSCSAVNGLPWDEEGGAVIGSKGTRRVKGNLGQIQACKVHVAFVAHTTSSTLDRAD